MTARIDRVASFNAGCEPAAVFHALHSGTPSAVNPYPSATPRASLPAGVFREHPLLGLLYLMFLFLPLAFRSELPTAALLASLAALPPFLVLYFGRLGGWQPGLNTRWLGMAVLGLALLPLNPGGNTLLIYAAGFAGGALPARRAAAAGLAMGLATTGAFLWSYGLQPSSLAFALITLVLGGMVLAGAAFERLQQQRQADLRLSQDEVRRLGALAERERIARDLHDLLGHTLSLVVLKSELAGRLLPGDPEAARAQIGEVEQVARKALGEVREAVSGYRRGDFEGELAAARLSLLSAGVEVEVATLAPPRRAEVDHALALCLREACTNVLRHSGAARVSVDLHVENEVLQLRVTDDGRGGVGEGRGQGLRGMRERIEALGGSLALDSPAGGGSRLQLRIGEGWREAGG